MRLELSSIGLLALVYSSSASMRLRKKMSDFILLLELRARGFWFELFVIYFLLADKGRACYHDGRAQLSRRTKPTFAARIGTSLSNVFEKISLSCFLVFLLYFILSFKGHIFHTRMSRTEIPSSVLGKGVCHMKLWLYGDC